MSSNAKTPVVDFLLENHIVASLLSLVFLLTAVATASLSLLFLSGVISYGWPFFYVYLLDVKEKAATEEKAPAKRLHSIRPSMVGAN